VNFPVASVRPSWHRLLSGPFGRPGRLELAQASTWAANRRRAVFRDRPQQLTAHQVEGHGAEKR